MIQALIREKLDFVDNHDYWDHPQFLPGKKWSYPYVYGQTSSIMSKSIVPARIGKSRIFGKPFTVSEINFVYPNKYRMEEGPLLGAVSALQDWDGIFFFSWGHSRDIVLRKEPVKRFDSVGDPLKLISHRIVSLMFLQNMIKPASTAYAVPFSEKLYGNLDEATDLISKLGLYCKVGVKPEGKKIAGVNSINDLPDSVKKEIGKQTSTSETGELVLSKTKFQLKVIAPKIESIVLEKGSQSGKFVSVSGVETPQCITVASIDGLPLEKSSRLLVFQQTNALNKFLTFSSENMLEVEGWGRPGSILLKRGSANISLRLKNAENKTVKALNFDGTDKKVINSRADKKGLSFKADTANGTMIYLISNK